MVERQSFGKLVLNFDVQVFVYKSIAHTFIKSQPIPIVIKIHFIQHCCGFLFGSDGLLSFCFNLTVFFGNFKGKGHQFFINFSTFFRTVFPGSDQLTEGFFKRTCFPAGICVLYQGGILRAILSKDSCGKQLDNNKK